MDVRLVTVMTITQLLMLIAMTDARSKGPPVKTFATLCTDMKPKHGGSSQTSKPPYSITTSDTCYTPGQALKGKI